MNITQEPKHTVSTKLNRTASKKLIPISIALMAALLYSVSPAAAEGKPNKQVAAELGVSFKTVDKHRQHLMGKLNIHDVAGLTRYAIAEGIIEGNVRVTID